MTLEADISLVVSAWTQELVLVLKTKSPSRPVVCRGKTEFLPRQSTNIGPRIINQRLLMFWEHKVTGCCLRNFSRLESVGFLKLL